MDVQQQRLWIESINKEASTRLHWHLRYSKQFAKAAFHSRPKKEGMKFGNEIAQRIRLLEERGKTKTRAVQSGKEPDPPAQVGSSSAVCTLHLAAVNSASTDEYVCDYSD